MNEFEFEVLKRDLKEYKAVFFRLKDGTVGAFIKYNGHRLNVIHKFDKANNSSKNTSNYSTKKDIIESLMISAIEDCKSFLKPKYIKSGNRKDALLKIDSFAHFAYGQFYDFLNIYLNYGYTDLLDDLYEDIWSVIDHWDQKGYSGVEIYNKLLYMKSAIEVDKLRSKYVAS